MENILLIGSLNLFWFQKYVDKVVLKTYHPESIWLLTDECKEECLKQYQDLKVHIVVMRTLPSNSALFFIRLLKEAMRIKSRMHFDIIHVQYVSVKSLILARLIKSKKTKTIATFWGSDIALQSEKVVKRFDFLLREFDVILTTAKRIENIVKERLCRENAKKVKTIHFGLDSLKVIRKIKQHNTAARAARKKLGIDQETLTIAIGYNARPLQQHLKVLEALATLQDEIKSKILVLLPMTYLREGNENYIEQVKKACTGGGLRYLAFESFMQEPENTYLHVSADIYVNAQKSDALSGSVLEFTYGGALLLNAAWLSYPEYAEWGIHYKSFYEFSEIPLEISSFVSGMCLRSDEAAFQKMYEGLSWEYLLARYRELYKTC